MHVSEVSTHRSRESVNREGPGDSVPLSCRGEEDARITPEVSGVRRVRGEGPFWGGDEARGGSRGKPEPPPPPRSEVRGGWSGAGFRDTVADGVEVFSHLKPCPAWIEEGLNEGRTTH